MNSFKNIFKKLLLWAGGSVMTLLGFGSCSTTPIEDNLLDPTQPTAQQRQYLYVVAYGTLTTAYYKVTGTVRDPSGKPVKGIQVVIESGNDYPMSTTDSKGRFVKSFVSYSIPTTKLRVFFQDVDGTENGGFFPSQGVVADAVKITDGNNAFKDGAYEVKVNVRLRKE